METPGFDTGRFLLTHFTFGAGRCWIVRALGANPIIRLTDRVEAVGAVLVIILILIATAITGASAPPSMTADLTCTPNRPPVAKPCKLA
ncbi:hypothetical protein BN970_04515 [Mycolicibacterium conceptionense]|uniref:Uncharacterized protein n=1 Tax=Mycolicibacterium conceptionense TaxID=451644 RepID=A0A0U1DN93_9MYCO|nr:hypothetical protein BN970_04515 [Mycolicibacterium conceptionense]